jgi:hypothetical protein
MYPHLAQQFFKKEKQESSFSVLKKVLKQVEN